MFVGLWQRDVMVSCFSKRTRGKAYLKVRNLQQASSNEVCFESYCQNIHLCLVNG